MTELKTQEQIYEELIKENWTLEQLLAITEFYTRNNLEAVKWYKNRTSASVCTDWLIFFNLKEADLKGKIVGVVDNLNNKRVAELREEDLK